MNRFNNKPGQHHPEAAFIFDEDETAYRFHDKHPFNQKRLQLTLDLLRSAGALSVSPSSVSSPATADQLRTVHSKEYIDAVQALSGQSPPSHWQDRAPMYGFDSEDTPYFAGMHRAAALIAGGSLDAVELVMTGRVKHALHLGGGLHHALAGKGAGFCIYNDASIAAAHAKLHYGARVLYIDTDVHHGDGVQWSFYTEPEVCTYSIHETGKYLFPGTGGVSERGDGEGFGTSINVPVEPFTEDESWLECFERTLIGTAESFRPDLIISQHGCDAHAFDPLSHIHCSMKIYKEMPRLIHQLAHQYCGGRWVALGGGGYDIWRVVPRAWSLLWMEMSEQPLLRELEANPVLPLPQAWRERWQAHSAETLPMHWLDPVSDWSPMPRREEITLANRRTAELAALYLR